ncbi:MAG: hypothetical protein CMM91_08500 [Rickettsiales bacterium]|nr:hypothetical protein [Rickettsiales bacterium]
MNKSMEFQYSYLNLPEIFFTVLNPTPVLKPEILLYNNNLDKKLNLNFLNLNHEKRSLLLSGNELPKNLKPFAQAYAGHQFGNFTILGDGRAIIIGEILTQKKKRYDIQFKGSGLTPYSRNGDGRAAIGPMLREYLVSEAMFNLNIKTSRSLAVVSSGEYIHREKKVKGAILTRIAESHIRIGTFQYAAIKSILALKKLTDYTIKRHYPSLIKNENPPLDLLKELSIVQIRLVVDWMRVGFIHGVMNTDNVTLSGETIDYGPCAFMNHYHPMTTFSSIDFGKRYSFGNQGNMILWNLVRFAESLIPLIHEDEKKAIKLAQSVIENVQDIFKTKWIKMMKLKMGFLGNDKNDLKLVNKLLELMNKFKLDYTNTFRNLSNHNFDLLTEHKNKDIKDWYQAWKKRVDKNSHNLQCTFNKMKKTNPLIIPRNLIVEDVLSEAEKNDNLKPLNDYLKILSKPYQENQKLDERYTRKPSNNQSYQTFCGT